MLEERISKNIGVPYVYLPDKEKFLCENGVLFTKEEYINGIDLNSEYHKREKEDLLYDYQYAKNTGILRKKPKRNKMIKFIEETPSEEINQNVETTLKENKKDVSVGFICLLLAFTSVISMYISTLHTATYLLDYTDLLSAWFMSASVTAYNATAFEVSVLFKSNKRYSLSFIFMFLWFVVTLFSMLTTVSVFYDQFNFQEIQIAKENKTTDSNKLALELLQKKEADLREAIEFKKADIKYRQEKDYATTAVRNELTKLENELQLNLTEQENIVKETPEIKEEKTKRKESLFSFLGRLMKIEGNILEFIMSTLSAIFVNLISPFSLSAVTELRKKNLTK